MIVSSEFPPGPGGIGNHCYNIANELALLGNDILVVTFQDYSTISDIRDFNSKQIFRIKQIFRTRRKTFNFISAMINVRGSIKNFNPQICIATGSTSSWNLAILNFVYPFKWVAVGHGSEFGSEKKLRNLLTRMAFNKANTTIAVSHFTKSLMIKHGIKVDQINVVHNGADARKLLSITPSANHKFDIPQNMNILLTVGNLTKRKGQEVVIKALPYLKRHNNNFLYLMAGLPTEIERHMELAEDLGVEENIKFLGKVDDATLASLYKRCDIFLMTSQKLADGDVEGFGIGVIEAALFAKPAIVSKGSGLMEAIEEGVTGISVNESDEIATYNAIQLLLYDPELRNLLGENARTRALRSYTWEKVSSRYETILNSVVNDGNK